MAEKLSQNFNLEEFTASSTAKAKGISNIPIAVHKSNLKYLCVSVLEPLRTLLNAKYTTYQGKKVKSASIKITSGYRSPALNKAVGGSTTSAHTQGLAADFDVVINFTDGTKKTIPYTETYENIKGWVKVGKLTLDQLIQEKSGFSTWIHIGLKPDNNRKQFMKYFNGKYTQDKS